LSDVQVVDPTGSSTQVSRGSMSQIIFTQTDNKGVHEVLTPDSGEILERFSVNLFSPRESQIVPTEEIGFGGETVAASPAKTPSRLEFWRWLTALAIGLLTVEWIIYLRRIFL
jgi:hypothetical protein